MILDDLFVITEGEHVLHRQLNTALLNQLRARPLVPYRDEDVAHHLIQLLAKELPSEQWSPDLSDAETADAVRCLDVVLNRLGITLHLPYRSRRAYARYVSETKSEDLDEQLHSYRSALAAHERRETVAGYRGVAGDVRNLIFAASYKPELILRDVTQGIVEVIKNKEHCLLYDRPVTSAGLTMAELVDWWGFRDGEYDLPREEQVDHLRERLTACLQSEEEKVLLNAYWSFAQSHGFERTPAILSQVYLHYDPVNQKDRDAQGGRVLLHQRMDFLLLAPGGRRFLLEVDGMQHYGEGDKHRQASRAKYAEMAEEDRELRLKGYEVYRFGTKEFDDEPRALAMLGKFFARLLDY